MASPKSSESSIKRTVKTDGKGNLHLDVPIGEPEKNLEVEVTWREVHPLSAEDKKRKRAELEALAGAFADDPLVRPEQPVLDPIPPLE
jgi:hypothetical protein